MLLALVLIVAQGMEGDTVLEPKCQEIGMVPGGGCEEENSTLYHNFVQRKSCL